MSYSAIKMNKHDIAIPIKTLVAHVSSPILEQTFRLDYTKPTVTHKYCAGSTSTTLGIILFSKV